MELVASKLDVSAREREQKIAEEEKQVRIKLF
jgi:hypothetical protein